MLKTNCKNTTVAAPFGAKALQNVVRTLVTTLRRSLSGYGYAIDVRGVLARGFYAAASARHALADCWGLSPMAMRLIGSLSISPALLAGERRRQRQLWLAGKSGVPGLPGVSIG